MEQGQKGRRSVRRAAVWTSAVVLGLTGVAACSSSKGGGSDASGGGGGGATSITVQDYYTDQPATGIWESVIKSCAQQAGVTPTFQHVPGGNLIAKVLQQASSHTLPDLEMLDNPDLGQIAKTGGLAPLSDFGVNADGYLKGVVAASTYQGKLYGLQPITNSIALFYNKDVFAAAGLQPPTTWDELKSTASKLTSGKQYGFAFSAPATYEGTWQFLPFMWSNGGDEKNLATDANAGALQLWVDMVKDGSVSKSVVNWTQADVKDQFAAGNAAMMINGPWQFPTLDAVTSLHYGVVPIPVPHAGDTLQVPLGGETWTIPQTGNKDRQQKAAAVLKCMNSDANQVSIAKQTQTVPTKTSLQDTFATQVPSMKAFTEEVKTARSRTGELGADWPAAATKIYTAVQSALVGGQSPSSALKSAQNG